ncbi:metallophosphoesterase [Bacteroides caccae]|uniref:metallophosphoesterase n=1 Tax=Bacteroides caccae TaxID=47678 RepID=UPI0032EC2C63
MKTLKHICQSVLFICLFALEVIACSDNKDGEQITPSVSYVSEDIDMTLSRLILPVKAEGREYKITVNSTPGITWEVKVTKGDDFLTVTPVGKQEQSGEILLKVSANEEEQPRTAIVQLSNSLDYGKKELIFEQEAVVVSQDELSFAVLSDLHYGRRTGTEYADVKTPRALKMILEKQPKVKTIFVCGDMTDGGSEAQYRAVQELFRKNLPQDVKAYFMLGNHECYNKDTEQYFNDTFAQPLHQYIEQGGYPFITLSVSSSWADYDETAVEFLRKHLEKAARDYPGKPIFVFSHAPSEKETAWGPWLTKNQLHETLSNYKQVIHFTGHSHFSIEDERSIKQDRFTWLNIGPGYYGVVSELDVNDIYDERYPASGENVTEGLIVDCNTNTDVRITRLDTKHNKEIKTPWVIKAPHDGSQFIYTDKRTGGDVPIFSQDISVENITTNSCTVVIPQATDDDLVAKYRVEISSSVSETRTYQVYSDCFLREDMPSIVKWNITGLVDNITYTVRVKAVDSFGGESISKVKTFTTEKWTIDPNATAPKADLIDVMFAPDGVATNVASSGLTPVLGNAGQKPAVTYNPDLKMYVSSYANDNKKFFKIDYSTNNDFKTKVKEAFTCEVYCKTNNTARQCPFSGLESSFIGFQMNESGTNKYYAMFNCTKGGYQRILYPAVETTRYYHYVFTFDGTVMNAYLDGQLIGTLAGLSGEVRINSEARNQWMCIGGDSPNYTAGAISQFPFQGEIAFCRMHSKAANSSEVYRLYEQVEKRKSIGKFNELEDKLPSLSGSNLIEGWSLMNDIATTEAQITAFLTKVQ